jgi:predicted dehydrogenase
MTHPTRFTAAILGMGVMGKNHFRVLRAMHDIEVIAVCDITEQSSYGVQAFTSPESLLAACKPDFAVVAVPTPLHLKIATPLIRAGVNLLIEKPAASNDTEAALITDESLKAGIKIAIGHIERFNPVVTALKRELAGRDICNISISRIGPLPPRIADVGILTDLAVHDIDLIRFITNDTIEKSTIYSSQKLQNHFEDAAILSFRLKKGALAGITTNWLTPFKKRCIEVATPDAYFEADLISQELREYASLPDDDAYVKSRSCPVQKGEPLAAEDKAFVNWLATNDSGNLASLNDSRLTLQIIEDARS